MEYIVTLGFQTFRIMTENKALVIIYEDRLQ